MPRVRHASIAAFILLWLVLAGCTAGGGAGEAASDAGDGESAEGEGPPPLQPTVSPPADPVTVLAEADPAEQASAASGALFDEAPLVLLATVDDPAAQTRAASVAVQLGVPLLLTADEPSTALETELDRLGTETILAFGDAGPPGGEDRRTLRVPSDVEALSELIGTDLGDERPVEAGGQLAAVATLDRDDAAVLALEDTEPTPTGESTDEATEPATDEATEPATDEATPAEDAEPLPPLEPPDDVESLLVAVVDDGDDHLAAIATARAAGARAQVMADPDPRADPDTIAALADTAPADHVLALGEEFGDADQAAHRFRVAATGVELPGGGQVLFPGRRMVALYGHPESTVLGALGEQPLEPSLERARAVAEPYEAFGDVPVIPAFEIIASIASAGAGDDGNYSSLTEPDVLRPHIDAARDAGFYVVLDLQPGRSDFLSQAQRYEELLLEPHVGLALDPEWRLGPDQLHMRQIGSVDAAEVNEVVDWLAELVREHDLPQKLLVLHQFRFSMLPDREDIDFSRDELALLIHMDGNGPPGTKRETWASLTAEPPPGAWWGWKNFYDEDSPMMSPAETMEQDPELFFISYQ